MLLLRRPSLALQLPARPCDLWTLSHFAEVVAPFPVSCRFHDLLNFPTFSHPRLTSRQTPLRNSSLRLVRVQNPCCFFSAISNKPRLVHVLSHHTSLRMACRSALHVPSVL